MSIDQETVRCTTCDGTGETLYRGRSHRDYDEPDYYERCAICGGGGELPAAMFVDVEYEDDEALA